MAIAPVAADPFKLTPLDDGPSAGAASDAPASLLPDPAGGEGDLFPRNGDGGEPDLWDFGDTAGETFGAALGGGVWLVLGAPEWEVVGATAETMLMRAIDMRARTIS